jgi:hypothetical protein
MKVKGRKLRQDGERALLTVDPDPVHPQRYVRPPGPDGNYGYMAGPGEQNWHVTRIDLSRSAIPDASIGKGPMTLRKDGGPFVICDNGGSI